MSCFAFETAFSSRWTLFSISVIPSITASYSPPSAGVVSMVNPLYSIFISISNSYPGVLPAWKVPLPVISGRPGSSSNRFRGSAAFFRILAWHAFSGLRSFVRKLSDLRRQGDKPRFLAIVPPSIVFRNSDAGSNLVLSSEQCTFQQQAFTFVERKLSREPKHRTPG